MIGAHEKNSRRDLESEELNVSGGLKVLKKVEEITISMLEDSGHCNPSCRHQLVRSGSSQSMTVDVNLRKSGGLLIIASYLQ
jgi:hypothetical protein